MGCGCKGKASGTISVQYGVYVNGQQVATAPTRTEAMMIRSKSHPTGTIRPLQK